MLSGCGSIILLPLQDGLTPLWFHLPLTGENRSRQREGKYKRNTREGKYKPFLLNLWSHLQISVWRFFSGKVSFLHTDTCTHAFLLHFVLKISSMPCRASFHAHLCASLQSIILWLTLLSSEVLVLYKVGHSQLQTCSPYFHKLSRILFLSWKSYRLDSRWDDRENKTTQHFRAASPSLHSVSPVLISFTFFVISLMAGCVFSESVKWGFSVKFLETPVSNSPCTLHSCALEEGPAMAWLCQHCPVPAMPSPARPLTCSWAALLVPASVCPHGSRAQGAGAARESLGEGQLQQILLTTEQNYLQWEAWDMSPALLGHSSVLHAGCSWLTLLCLATACASRHLCRHGSGTRVG